MKPSLDELKDWPIQHLLPHAAPMIMIDRLVAVSEDTVEAEVAIRPDSLFCDGRKVEAWVGVEYMAQTVGAYAGCEAALEGRPVKVGFLLGTRSYDCRVPSFPVGSVLRVRAKKILHEPMGLGVLECSIREAGDERPLVEANLNVFEVEDLAAYIAENVK